MSIRALGILAFFHPNTTRPFGEQTGYIRSLLVTAKKLGVPAFAFGPEHVELERGRVTALVPAEAGWRKVQRPLPRLVYDRFFLHLPRPGVLRRYRRLLRSQQFRFLNPTLPDKWKVHTVLSAEQRVRQWLPGTWLFRDAGQLWRLLRLHRRLVLKPKHGMKGRGLWFIELNGRRIVVGKGTGGRSPLDQEGFRRWASRQINSKYIIQQELLLKDQAGRPFDIRVLVQRNRSNELLVTGMGVRVGKAGALVANLHQGGSAITLAAAVEKIPDLAVLRSDTAAENVPRAEAAYKYITGVSLQIAKTLDRQFGPLAEVGLDFGFDRRTKRLFFIEANSRPGRIIFRRMGDHTARELAIRRPLEYAGYRLRLER